MLNTTSGVCGQTRGKAAFKNFLYFATGKTPGLRIETWGTRFGGGARLGAEDEGVGVGVGGLVGEVESEAGGVLGEGERAGTDEFDALDGLG